MMVFGALGGVWGAVVKCQFTRTMCAWDIARLLAFLVAWISFYCRCTCFACDHQRLNGNQAHLVKFQFMGVINPRPPG